VRAHWQPARDALARIRDAYVAALAAYAPVHKRLRKAIDATFLGRALRAGFTAVSVYFSGGTSLIFKGVLMLFNEKRAADALARFETKRAEFEEVLRHAAAALDRAVADEAAANLRRDGALVEFAMRALFAEYAHRSDSHQLRIAEHLASRWGRSIAGPWRGAMPLEIPRVPARVRLRGPTRWLVPLALALAMILAATWLVARG